MGKASRRKKKLASENHADERETVRYSKGRGSPQINKGFQKRIPKAKLWIIIVFILLSSSAVYFNSLPNDFIWDDTYQVLKNPWITDIKYMPDIFSKNVWGFRKDISTTNYYRPMMHLVYMMNFHIFGLKPWGFHLINVLFHSGISVLVFIVASRLLRGSALSTSDSSLAPPFIAALLFATHPIHTEAVTWIAGLPDLSFTFFFFISFYFYIRSTGDDQQFKGAYFVSVASFFVAALCKETALTLPVILVAYDYAFRRRNLQFVSALKRYSPYLLSACVYFILRFHALGHFAPVKRHMELTTYEYLINAFPLFMQYLEKLILPTNLNAFYVLHPISSLSETRGMLSLIVMAAFVILTFIGFKKNKAVFLGLLFIMVTLLPVLYIPALGPATFTERYLYLPSFGFVLLLGSLMDWAKMNKPAVFASLAVAFTVIAVFYSIETVSRNTVWKDSYTLRSDMVRKSPDATEPHNDLGAALYRKGLIDEAIEQWQIALRLNPNYVEAHNNLGGAFYMKGRIDEAIGQYQIALRLKPDYTEAHHNLGLAFFNKGSIDEAIKQYQIALRLDPNYVDARNNLGLAFLNEGLIDEAIEQCQIALRLNPDHREARKTLADALKQKKQLNERS